jgi:hypothetical protein
MSDLGKCMVKGCDRLAEAASIAFLKDGLAIPCVVCAAHLAEVYDKLYGKPKRRGRKPAHGQAQRQIARAVLDTHLGERAFQQIVCEAARLTGWLCYHTFDSRRSTPGFPDLVLCHPVRRQVIFAELKTARGRVSAAQQVWHAALVCCPGVEVHIWRPGDLDAILAMLQGKEG